MGKHADTNIPNVQQTASTPLWRPYVVDSNALRKTNWTSETCLKIKEEKGSVNMYFMQATVIGSDEVI